MTEKLYYIDSHLFEFDASVLSCRPDETAGGRYAVILDRTAFFPEGGGQLADTGTIGDVRVSDVQEADGEIIHYVSLPVSAGPVHCILDSEQRRRRMQNHSGEHIVSGLVHNGYGYDNVGFHMGDRFMTIDFSGELSWDQLSEIERKANEAVRANIPVRTFFPEASDLKQIEYRSKLELTENVRIVEIEGVDRCACCAPHVSRTGEIGIIKLLGCERHRGGVRVELVCGMDALDDYRIRQQSVTEISNMLSSKRDEISLAVEKVRNERDELKYALAGMENELVKAVSASFPDTTDGNITVFRDLSEPACRELVNLLVPKCTGMAAVFFSGSDSGTLRYIIGSRNIDLRAKAKEINAAINGRGGGKPEMIMGSAAADRSVIENYFL